MYQLNYRSTAKTDLKLIDLDAILTTASTINATKNITGCLIYHNNSFVQILEGNKKDVQLVYEKIESDPRHQEISLLWEADVEKRYFKEWNMAYYKPNDKNMVQFVNNMLLLSQLSDRSSGSLLSFWSNVHKILKNEGAIGIH